MQFRVSLSKNCWICFGDCHAGGSIVDFVSRRERIGIREAALLIQEWFGLTPNRGAGLQSSCSTAAAESQAQAQSIRASQPSSNEPLSFALTDLDQNHPYLVNRSLHKATLKNFGVGYCRHGTLAGWIAIPIHNPSDQLVAYAGRWPGQPPDGQPKYK